MANTLAAPKYVQDTWPPPNFVDPEIKGHALEYVSIAFSAFGLVVVLLRCYSRIFMTRAFGLDDTLIIVAFGLSVALAVLLIIGIEQWYIGYHIWDLPAHSVVDHRRGMWIASYITVCSSCCIRISILLFYRRLSVSFTRSFLVATWVGIAYNLCLMISMCLVTTFICWPVQAFWMRYELNWRDSHDWKCGNEGISLPTSGILTVIGDVYCTVLPLVLVVTLKIPQRQKTALYFLFGLGFLACGAGIARVTILTWTVWRTWDFTWMIYDMWIWNNVELFIGIFAASAPALKPLMRTLMGSRFLGYSYTYGSRNSRMTAQDHSFGSAREAAGTVPYSKECGVPDGSWKSPEVQINKMSSDGTNIKHKEQDQDKDLLITGSASFSSAGSIIQRGQTSVQGFAPQTLDKLKAITGSTPILADDFNRREPKESLTVEVDPPIYPPTIFRKSQPSRASQYIGDGLPSQGKTLVNVTPQRDPVPTKEPDNAMSDQSSPIPLSNQYLTSHGWVELKPVKKPDNKVSADSMRGSVKAARIRAGAQNESRIIEHSAPSSDRTFYDAESSHDLTIIPTVLPKTIHPPANRSSNDLTRLDYSDSSETASTQDLGQFHFDLSSVGSGSVVTALPRGGSR